MSRLCRLKSYKNIGEDGKWAYDEIIKLRRENENLLEAICKSTEISDSRHAQIQSMITFGANIQDEIIKLRREVGHQQSTIDALMLEFCPERMTREQVDLWSDSQEPIDQGYFGIKRGKK